MLYGIAGSGVVVLAAVVVFIAVAAGGGSSGSKGVETALKDADCTYKVVKGDTIGHHVTSLKAKIKYNTFPPSSGTHYYVPAVWDFYTDPVNPIQVVHNEEHGGVIMWWGPGVSESTIEELRTFYNEDPVSMLGTPIAGLDSKVALTAWTKDAWSELHAKAGRTFSLEVDAREWSQEEHLRALLGGAFELELRTGTWRVEAESGEELWEMLSNSMPPLRAWLAAADDTARTHAERVYRGFLQPGALEREYVLVLGTRR